VTDPVVIAKEMAGAQVDYESFVRCMEFPQGFKLRPDRTGPCHYHLQLSWEIVSRALI